MKKTKKRSLIEAEIAHELFLKRVGYTGRFNGETPYDLPSYKHEKRMTSDKIDNGIVGKTNQYTGDELLGIATMHKSNIVPIRKDNREAVIETATMRRN